MAAPVYVLDANVFIEAARRYYAFDLAPRFWDGLIQGAEDGVVESVDWVRRELDKGKDKLAEWANTDFSRAFRSTDAEDVFKELERVMNWVQDQPQFTDPAKVDFAKGADGWLVAYAMARDRVVVTHEVLAPEARNKVPMPNVCRPFGIMYTDTFQMMRELGIRFA